MAGLLSTCVACAVVAGAMLADLELLGVEIGSRAQLVEEPVPVGSWAIPWGGTMAPPSVEQARQTRALRTVTAATASLLTLLCLLVAASLWRQRLRLRRAEDRVHWAVGARRLQLVARLAGQGWPWAASTVVLAFAAAVGIPALVESTFPGRAWVPPGILAALLVTVAVGVVVLGREAEAGRRAARPAARGPSASPPAAVLVVGFTVLTGVGLLSRHAPGIGGSTGGSTDVADTTDAGGMIVAGASLEGVPERDRGALLADWLRPASSTEAGGATPAAGGSPRPPRADGSGLPPGVASAGIVRGIGRTVDLWVDCGNCFEGGFPMPFKTVVAEVHSVASDTFPHLGLAILEGRDFDEATDHGAPDAVIVSRALAIRHFEGGEAVGRSLRVGDSGWLTVVGVVSDAADVRDHTEYVVYLPLVQAVPGEIEIFASAGAGNPRPLRPWIAAPPAGVDVADPRLLGEIFAMHGWFARTMQALGVGAYLLVLVGVWLGSRNEARATAFELSLRRAVGATRGHLRMLFVRTSGRRVAIALACGAWLSLFLGAGLNAAFGGIPQIDPGVWLRSGGLVVAAYLVGAGPAFVRAGKIPPAVGLAGSGGVGRKGLGQRTADPSGR